MKNHNTIGVDLAKNVIYVSVLSSRQKLLQSKEVTRSKFKQFLANQKPALVAFEACATAHYWSRFAQSHGHTTKIIPALAVAPFRQGHKTDKNDALAVAEAANRPNIKEAPYKTINQQAVQSIQRSRELLVSDRTALSNHIRGILLEFGFAIRQGYSALYQHVPDILEDGENELPDSYRATLNLLYVRLRDLREDIDFMDKQIATVI
ncbi:MAG: IS110 family transposase, partial [Gammaproteobacteria bacterium]|nr:IS110 family transposase [Gammaproteobacteria bacterium]